MTYLQKALLIFICVFRILNALDCQVCDGELNLGPTSVQDKIHKIKKTLKDSVKKLLPDIEKLPKKGT